MRKKMLYKLARQELKNEKASDYKEGDVIKTGIYFIHNKDLKPYEMPILP